MTRRVGIPERDVARCRHHRRRGPTLVAGSHGPWVGVIVSTLPFAEPTKKRSNSGYEKRWRTGLLSICSLGRSTSPSFTVQRRSRTHG